jgi:PhnB protein
VRDPFGDLWIIATHQRAAAPEEAAMQESAQSQESRHGVMPFMYIEDAAGAFEFYQKVFGATELQREVQPGGKVSHLQMAIGETRLMLRDATTKDLAEYRAKGFARTPHQLGGTPLHLYIYVPDPDAVFNRAIAAGSKVTDPLGDQEWGDRCGGFQDPFGHIWYVATPIAQTSH